MAKAGFGMARKGAELGHVCCPINSLWYKEAPPLGGGTNDSVSLVRRFNKNGGKPRMYWQHRTNFDITWPKQKNDVRYGLEIKDGRIYTEELKRADAQQLLDEAIEIKKVFGVTSVVVDPEDNVFKSAVTQTFELGLDPVDLLVKVTPSMEQAINKIREANKKSKK